MKQTATRPEPVVALVGSTSLLGKEIKDSIADGRFVASRVNLFEPAREEAVILEFHGEPAVANPVKDDSFQDADLVILSTSAEEAEPLLGNKRKPGSILIDVSGAAAQSGAPVIDWETNPERLGKHRGTVAAAQPASLFVSGILSVLDRAFGISSAEATVLEPASGLGQEAMDELFHQSTQLLNFGSIPTEFYGRQAAFNLLPLSLAEVHGGVAREESIAKEIRAILGWEAGRLGLQVVLAPVFHCHSASVRLRMKSAATLAAVTELLAADRRFDLRHGNGSGKSEWDTPVEWAGQERIRIGELLHEPSGVLRVWMLVDDLKGGAARNAVQIAVALFPR